MKRIVGSHWFKRITASVVLVAYGAGCTHMPSGEKAFDSFDSCFASNMGLAVLGGIGVGVLGKKLAKGSKKANAIGAAAGIAATTMIALTAWRKCAAVYSKSEQVAQPRQAQTGPVLPAAASRQRRPSLSLDKLDMKLEGSENDPPVPEFSFSFLAEDPAAKDIKARFRHKVEIVRFMADDNDALVLADADGKALLDSAGKPIPLEAASTLPREKLRWVTIADEGKEDYVEDVVIQQGEQAGYRHKLQVPPRDQLPLPLPVPMRYTLTVEADRMKSMSIVDFALLGSNDRPRRYAGSQPMNSGEANAAAATRSLSDDATAGFAPTHVLKRKASLYNDTSPKRKVVASLKAGARVQVREQAQVKVNNKPVAWVKVETEQGTGGWIPAGELAKH